MRAADWPTYPSTKPASSNTYGKFSEALLHRAARHCGSQGEKTLRAHVQRLPARPRSEHALGGAVFAVSLAHTYARACLSLSVAVESRETL